MHLILLLFLLILSSTSFGQTFCFYNPNTGGHYHNGSSGAIYDVTAGDFNNDGQMDIVTANSTAGSISFIPGNGDGTLGAPDTIPAFGVLFAINSADLDDDGNLDIVTSNGPTVFVYYGNGDGTFQNYKSFQGGSAPSRLYLDDVNFDGKEDIILAGGQELTILHQVNNNLFTFPLQIPAGGEINDLTINYFDGDTIRDIVATIRESPSVSKLAFFKGNSVGTFAMPVLYNVPDYSVFGISSMDTDKDGNIDLIVANHRNTLSRIELYKGNGDGTFNAPIFYSAYNSPSYVHLEDMDNDGNDDIVVVDGSGFSILRAQGDTTFQPYQYFSSMPSPNSIAIADFNNDGKLDVSVPSAYIGSPLIGMNINCTPLGIEYADPNSLVIYPNPSAGTYYIRFPLPSHDEFQIFVTDPIGRRIDVRVNETGSNEALLSLRDYPSGTYYVHMIRNGRMISKMLLKI